MIIPIFLSLRFLCLHLRLLQDITPKIKTSAFTDDSEDKSRFKRRSNGYDEGNDYGGSEDEITAEEGGGDEEENEI